jgi:RadC-like JAB domain
MSKVQIAYEQVHECKEGCGCAESGVYIDLVQQSLADLGSDDPAGDVARHAKYVRGAQRAKLEPKQAAAMILAMSRPDEGYQPRYRFEDVAETAAHEYIAVDSRGKKVFGPTRDYGEAKLHADRSGGTVRFEMSASEPLGRPGRKAPSSYRPGNIFVIEWFGDEGTRKMGEREFSDRAEAAAFYDSLVKGGTDPSDIIRFLRDPAPPVPPPSSGLQTGSRVTIETPLRPAGSGGSGHPKLGYVVKLGKRGALVATADGEEWYPIDRLTADGYVSPDYAMEMPYEKPLRFHRGTREGTYVAQAGHLGTMRCSQRAPDRRHGRLPWVVMIKKVEVAQAETKMLAYAAAESFARAPKSPASKEPPPEAQETPGANCVILKDGRVERSPDCMPTDVKLATADDVYRIMRPYFEKRGDEEFYVLGATLQQTMVGQPILVAAGQTSSVRVSVNQVLKAALGLNAGAACEFWVAHGHPSETNDEHSESDAKLTKALRKGFEASFPECKFRGHVVCARDGFTVS